MRAASRSGRRGTGNLNGGTACCVTCGPESYEPVSRSCLCWGHDESPFTDGYLCAGFQLGLPSRHLCSAGLRWRSGTIDARDAAGRPHRQQRRGDAVAVSGTEVGDQLSSAR